jgi:hypothetical protein
LFKLLSVIFNLGEPPPQRWVSFFSASRRFLRHSWRFDGRRLPPSFSL